MINDGEDNIWLCNPSSFDRIQFDDSARPTIPVKIDYYNRSEGIYDPRLLSARKNNLFYKVENDIYSMDINKMTKEYDPSKVIIQRINLLYQHSVLQEDNRLNVIFQTENKEEVLRLDYTNNYLEIEYNVV